MKKRKGQSWLLSVYMGMILVSILIFYTISREQIYYTKVETEDALTSSCLAALIIDPVMFSSQLKPYLDESKSLEIFDNCFEEALNLNEDWSGNVNHSVFDFEDGKKIELKEFIVYNVPMSGDAGEQHIYKNGMWNSNYNQTYPCIAPDGSLIDETSIYCQIEIPVKTYFGVRRTAIKSEVVGLHNIN